MTIRPLHLLCDMDGTLIDTEGLKCEAWRLSVADLGGVDPDRDVHRRVYASVVGATGPVIARRLIAHYRLACSAEALWERREYYRRRYYEDPAVLRELTIVPVLETVRAFRAGQQVLGVGKAVLVTSATTDQMDWVVGVLGIDALFDYKVSALEKSVENPACYRAALDILGCAPDDCLAVEDTLTGYHAARAAGIPCVLLPNAFVVEQSAARTNNPA